MKHLFFISALFFSASLFAQGGPGDPGGNPDGPVNTPIDGGVSMLIAGSIIYGAKKIREARKKNESENRK